MTTGDAMRLQDESEGLLRHGEHGAAQRFLGVSLCLCVSVVQKVQLDSQTMQCATQQT